MSSLALVIVEYLNGNNEGNKQFLFLLDMPPFDIGLRFDFIPIEGKIITLFKSETGVP